MRGSEQTNKALAEISTSTINNVTQALTILPGRCRTDLERAHYPADLKLAPALMVPTSPKITLDLVPLYKVYPENMAEGMTRGELAKQGQVNFETIRFYEEEGLLPKPPRSASGYRKYPGTAIRRLQFIKNAKELGFSLNEIRELLDLQVRPENACEDVRRKAEAKTVDVDEKIRHLQEIRKALVKITNTCSGRGPTSECSILQFLSEAKT